MSPRIVSWRIDEPRVSPSLSSASSLSIVSMDSIGSETHMMTTEATGVQPADPEAKLTYFPGSVKPTTDESFVRHNIYFFNDGNITFLVDGTLYCVHRYFFSRDSVYFSTKFSQLDVRDHEPLSTIIALGDIERKDFEAFLSVIYPENFEEHDLSYGEWKSILHLSTRWGFASLRSLALKSIELPTAFDQLLLARTYNVDHWVLPALSALCKRTRPTTLNEARQMSIEDVVLVATVREEIRRKKRPFVNTAEIQRLIEAAQVRMVAHVSSDDFTPDVTPDISENEATEKEPPKEAVACKVISYRDTEEAKVPKAVDMHGGDEHSVGTAEDSLAEFPTETRAKKKGTTRHVSWECDTGENSRVNVANSETIPDGSKAECTISRECEEIPTHPSQYPGSVCERSPPAPEPCPPVLSSGQPAMGPLATGRHRKQSSIPKTPVPARINGIERLFAIVNPSLAHPPDSLPFRK